MTETKALRSVKILILEPFNFVFLPILFCCPYYLQNYHSSVEIFALRGFKTVEGKEIKSSGQSFGIVLMMLQECYMVRLI